MTLLGAIDDATSQLLALSFRPTEDFHGYAVVFDQVFRQYGLPLAVYGDRLNILVRNDRHWSLEEELHGAQHPPTLAASCRSSDRYIQAHSPQAKGRVEAAVADLAGPPRQRTAAPGDRDPRGRQRLSADLHRRL